MSMSEDDIINWTISEDDIADDDDVKYVLSPWGCLSVVLEDYGIDISRISGKVGSHIVEDFLELLEKAGHILKCDDNEKA